MTDSEQIAAKVEAFMRGEGLSDEPWLYDSDIHSWRCEDPEHYGKCNCFQTFRDDLTALVAEVARAAAEKALMDAALDIWSRSPQGPESEEAVARLAELADAYRLERNDD